MDMISPDEAIEGALNAGSAIELKLLDSAADAGVIEGYASTFGGTDHGGDTILPGAFAETLADHVARKQSPAMLWAHRQAEPIGKWTAMGEDAVGLRVRGQLNLDTPAGRKAHAHLKAGDVSGLSIGFQVALGGQKAAGKTRVLSKLRLHEVSVVATPMDPRARVSEVKSLASRGDLEHLLRQSGLARGAARKIAAAGWPAPRATKRPKPPSAT